MHRKLYSARSRSELRRTFLNKSYIAFSPTCIYIQHPCSMSGKHPTEQNSSTSPFPTNSTYRRIIRDTTLSEGLDYDTSTPKYDVYTFCLSRLYTLYVHHSKVGGGGRTVGGSFVRLVLYGQPEFELHHREPHKGDHVCRFSNVCSYNEYHIYILFPCCPTRRNPRAKSTAVT